MVEDRLRCSRNVIDQKGNMGESRGIRLEVRVLRHGSILKDLQGRSAVAVAWQPEVHSEDVCTADPGCLVGPISGQIPLGRNRHASEHLLVEGCQPPPVFRDQVSMRVFSWHLDVPYELALEIDFEDTSNN